MPNLYKDDQNCDYRYTSWLNQTINLVAPKSLFAVLGRGTGKTTDILSDRLIDCLYDMPRAYFAFASDTYTHALADMVPTLLDGLSRKGLIYGVDYVTDERPPDFFEHPYKMPISYKHTISFRNGCFLKIVSMDEPSSMAGASYQHLFGDETKYLDFEVLKKLFPAIRGEYLIFKDSPFYRGMSFTTDMPNISDKKEFDWFMEMEKEMNVDQIKLILSAGWALNDAKIEYVRAYAKQNANKMEIYQRRMDKWEERWRKMRKNSTLFVVASSFVNVELLREDYFADQLSVLGVEEFKSSVLSMRRELEAGERFYINLGDHHFFKDGVRNDFYSKYLLTDKIEATSEALRYLKPNQSIEAGLDFGNMCSLVTGQTHGEYTYLMKEFYTLPPEHVEELAAQFLKFYRNHPRKLLELYYDPAGNANSQVGKSVADAFKKAIEFDSFGNRTGWTVDMKSKGRISIRQDREYEFMRKLLGETVKRLPKVKIDKMNCKCLVSSINLTKVEIRKNHQGQAVIKKDKSSEKKYLQTPKKLPMLSTNFSDAFKYFMTRPHWLELASGATVVTYDEPDFI